MHMSHMCVCGGGGGGVCSLQIQTFHVINDSRQAMHSGDGQCYLETDNVIWRRTMLSGDGQCYLESLKVSHIQTIQY